MGKKSSLADPAGTSLYLQSLQALQKKAPLLKTLLSLQTLSYQRKKKSLSLSEVQSLSQKILSSNLQICFFYGFFSLLTKELCSWLAEQPNRQILFFMDDLWDLKCFLHTQEGLWTAKHPQIHFFYLNSKDFWPQNEKEIKSYLGMPFEIFNLTNEATFEHFQETMTQLCLSQNSFFSEYLFTSPLVYQNIFQNLNSLSHSIYTAGLKNHFCNIPAIICGAGPSMNLDLETLKEISQKALIFAGGRALDILSQHHIEPHFTVGIDPYEMHHQTFSQNLFFEAPLIYRLRMNGNALQKAHGPTLYTSQAIGYPLVQWLEEQLGLSSHFFEEGLNVVNFSVQLAYFLGCNPIILSGCDLAYQDERPYSKSIVLNQKLPEANQVSSGDYSIHRGVFKKNSQGKPVYTLWKWVEEADWLSEFAQKHPKRDYYNSTLSGLEITGFLNVSLQQLASKHLTHEYDLSSLVHQSLCSQPLIPFSQKQLLSLKGDLLKSLSRCEHLLSQLMERALDVLLEEDLKQEVAYQKMLSMLDTLFESVEQEKEISKRKQKKADFLLSMTQKYLLSLKC